MLLINTYDKSTDNRRTMFIDDREDSLKPGVEKACEHLHLKSKVKRLDVGDYILGSSIAETKTWFDLIESVKKNYIIQQCENIKATGLNFFLGIIGHGGVREAAQRYVGTHITKQTAVQIEGMLHEFFSTAIFKRGIPVLFFQEEYDFVRFMKHADGAERKKLREGYKPKRGDSSLRAFSSPEGIGPDMAKKLKAKFGTVEKMLRCSDAELAKIDGLGKKRIAAIREAFE